MIIPCRVIARCGFDISPIYGIHVAANVAKPALRKASARMPSHGVYMKAITMKQQIYSKYARFNIFLYPNKPSKFGTKKYTKKATVFLVILAIATDRLAEFASKLIIVQNRKELEDPLQNPEKNPFTSRLQVSKGDKISLRESFSWRCLSTVLSILLLTESGKETLNMAKTQPIIDINDVEYRANL